MKTWTCGIVTQKKRHILNARKEIPLCPTMKKDWIRENDCSFLRTGPSCQRAETWQRSLMARDEGRHRSRTTASISNVAGATTMALGTASSVFRAETGSMNDRDRPVLKLTPDDLPANLGKGTYVLILQLNPLPRPIFLGNKKFPS